eukprot:GAFH01001354.1.p2 GENE.GAFH01001354.1~~GAFH01001354.1.p2  ORF type:complete len:514 (-),score=199.05 GAFH01001354.1:159-1676(-)
MQGPHKPLRFRHIFGRVDAHDTIFDVHPTTSTLESSFIKVNRKHIAVVWESGFGSVAVLPREFHGRCNAGLPTVQGNPRPILDIEWNPFNEDLLYTGSEDTNIRLFQIPEEGLKQNLMTPLLTLSGHTRKVMELHAHPLAANVLASVGMENAIRVWDVDKQQNVYTLDCGHTDSVSSFGWSYDGQRLISACRDKKMRMIDPRAPEAVQTFDAQSSAKTGKCMWLGRRDWIAAFNFSKTSQRQILLWDPRHLEAPFSQTVIDQTGSGMIPYYDEDLSCLYFGSRGETQIRYYELTDDAPFVHYTSTFAEGGAIRGLAPLHKKYIDHMGCEVTKLYKLTQTSVETVSFVAPRRADSFQEDLYPETNDDVPAMTSAEYFAGAVKPHPTFKITAGAVAKSTTPAAAAPKVVTPPPSASPAPSSSPVPSGARMSELEQALAAERAKNATLAARVAELEAKLAQMMAAPAAAPASPVPAVEGGIPASAPTPAAADAVEPAASPAEMPQPSA